MSFKSLVSGLVVGGLIGYSVSYMNKPLYTLKEKNEETFLVCKNVGKSYELISLNNDFYLGDLNHNLNGIKEVSFLEGLNINKNDLFDERQRNAELEDILKDQSRKIRKRRFFDKIEETKDKLHYWYNDKKRKMLD